MCGSASAQPVAQVAGRDAWLAGDVDLVEGAPLADHALGLGQREDRDARATKGRAAAELDDADDRVALGRRRAARDEHLLADLQFGALSSGFVDREFIGARGEAALNRRERVEAGGHLGGHERRRTALGEPFAVHVEERARREDRAGGLTHARGGAHPREHRFGDRRGFRAAVAPEHLGRRDHDVVAAVGRLEDAGEGLVDRVGEHIGARHQGHAERDRDPGEQYPQLALHEASEHQREHQPRLRAQANSVIGGRQPRPRAGGLA